MLADANLESKTDDEAIYLLRPDPTCRRIPSADDPPGTVPELNTAASTTSRGCEVRVSLRADGDGVRLGDPDRPGSALELSAFVIHSDLLALEMDLPRAYQATQVIDADAGQRQPRPPRTSMR